MTCVCQGMRPSMDSMRRSGFCVIWLMAAAVAAGQGVRRSECFAMEGLGAAERAESEALLLKALDSEALFTVVSGLKPMSGGFLTYELGVEKPDLERVERWRRLMKGWRCGGAVEFDFHHLARAFEVGRAGEERVIRYMEGVVFHRARVAETVKARGDLFGVYGLTESASPVEVLLAVEYNETADRYRGLGTLYGYPRAAVEFFAESTPISQERSRDPRKPAARSGAGATREGFGKRRFVNIPTYGREKGGFVYAVALEAEESEEDRRLKEQAGMVLGEYRKRRGAYVGEGKAGVVEMLRDWFCKTESDCSPAYARVGGQ